MLFLGPGQSLIVLPITCHCIDVSHLALQGVGSHAAHLLLRSGVRKLRLIDFDQVSLSSLNRHALATRADVGMPKATCLRVRPSTSVTVMLYQKICHCSEICQAG